MKLYFIYCGLLGTAMILNYVTAFFNGLYNKREWTARDVLYGSLISASLYLIIPSITSLFDRKSLKDASLNKRKDRYTTGLVNPANECYINSTLQALSSIDALTTYLNCYLDNTAVKRTDNDNNSNENVEHQTRALHLSLSDIIAQLQEIIVSTRTISNKLLVRTMERIFKGTLSRDQSDAHEFAQLLFESLQEEYKVYLNKPNFKDQEFPFKGETSCHYTCLKCHKSSNLKTEDFLLYEINLPQVSSATLLDVMNGQQNELIEDYSCIYCQINAVIQNEKIARNNLSEYEKEILDTLINIYPSLELNTEIPEHILQFVKYYNRNGCNVKQIKTTIVKKTIFKKCPQILSIHLNRSLFNGAVFTKNVCRLEAPKKFEIYEQDTIPNTTVPHLKKIEYKLKSVIKHTGTHYQGHYQCYKKKPRMMSYDLDQKIVINKSATINKSLLSAYGKELDNTDMTKPMGKKLKLLKSVKFYPYWLISDHSVKECKESTVLEDGKCVYMLFYERCVNV